MEGGPSIDMDGLASQGGNAGCPWYTAGVEPSWASVSGIQKGMRLWPIMYLLSASMFHGYWKAKGASAGKGMKLAEGWGRAWLCACGYRLGMLLLL